MTAELPKGETVLKVFCRTQNKMTDKLPIQAKLSNQDEVKMNLKEKPKCAMQETD